MAAAASPLPISVYEYLNSVYEPDMDYVDGALEDRNLGEFDHYLVQRALLLALIKLEVKGHFFVVQETRVQISPTRFRVPDTCLIDPKQVEQIITTPPLLCVEVLSPKDRLPRMKQRCLDYIRMGVPEVWILDPAERVLHVMRGEDGIISLRSGTLQVGHTDAEIPLSDLFGTLDRTER